MKKCVAKVFLNFLLCLRVLDFVKDRYFLESSTALETIESDLCFTCLGCFSCWRMVGHANHVSFCSKIFLIVKLANVSIRMTN